MTELADRCAATELGRLVNRHRGDLDLRALEHDEVLAAAARQHAQRMRNLGFFDHRDPFDHTRPHQRVRAAGRWSWALIAENLAAGQLTPDEVLRGWLDSPGHRANVELPELTHHGVAIVLGGRMRSYTAQVYATRAPVAISWQDVRGFVGELRRR
jgi:uncharacterized protein YkwD